MDNSIGVFWLSITGNGCRHAKNGISADKYRVQVNIPAFKSLYDFYWSSELA